MCRTKLEHDHDCYLLHLKYNWEIVIISQPLIKMYFKYGVVSVLLKER